LGKSALTTSGRGRGKSKFAEIQKTNEKLRGALGGKKMHKG